MLLGDTKVFLLDKGELSLSMIQSCSDLTLLCEDIGLDARVDVYGGLMSRTAQLIHIGNFVEFSDDQASHDRVSIA